MKWTKLPEYLNRLDEDNIHYRFEMKDKNHLWLVVDDWAKHIHIADLSSIKMWEISIVDQTVETNQQWNGREDLLDFFVELVKVKKSHKAFEVFVDENRYLLFIHKKMVNRKGNVKSFAYKNFQIQNKDLPKPKILSKERLDEYSKLEYHKSKNVVLNNVLRDLKLNK